MTPAVLAGSLWIAACGCVHPVAAGGEAAVKDAAVDRGARVQAEFQDRLLAKMQAATGWPEAWGLFSEGGWADEGQVVVLVSATGTGRVLTAEANRRTWAAERDLSAADVEALRKSLKDADTLTDIDIKSFDTLTFEFVHVKRDEKDRPVVVKRVYIRNPGTRDTPGHDAVIKAMLSLKQ